MIRFALILLMSLGLSSHAVAGRVFKDSGKTVVMGGDKKSAEEKK